MTTIISDAGVQFAGGNIVDIRSAVPTTGSYTQGDVVIEKSTNSELAGWKRLTTGSAHGLGTDWLYFGAMGVGQTWQNVITTPGRVAGTTYYNTTGKPIAVAIRWTSGTINANAYLSVGGVAAGYTPDVNPANLITSLFAVVPSGSSYVLTVSAAGTLAVWNELR